MQPAPISRLGSGFSRMALLKARKNVPPPARE